MAWRRGPRSTTRTGPPVAASAGMATRIMAFRGPSAWVGDWRRSHRRGLPPHRRYAFLSGAKRSAPYEYQPDTAVKQIIEEVNCGTEGLVNVITRTLEVHGDILIGDRQPLRQSRARLFWVAFSDVVSPRAAHPGGLDPLPLGRTPLLAAMTYCPAS